MDNILWMYLTTHQLFMHGPETYPSCKYWFHVSSTSLMGSSLLLLLFFFLHLYHQNIKFLNILTTLIFLKRVCPSSTFQTIKHFIFRFMKMKVTQWGPALYNPLDYTIHGILWDRILEWVVFSFSRGSSQLQDRTQVSRIEGKFFTSWATREAQ